MGELEVSDREEDILTTIILGSCVGVVLFDLPGKRAGMAHIMLPERIDPRAGLDKKAKYAVPGVKELYRRMLELGCSLYSLQAKICGGARMFGDNNLQNIGERNVIMTKFALRKLGIPLVGERTGGEKGRNVAVQVATGLVKVKDADGLEEIF